MKIIHLIRQLKEQGIDISPRGDDVEIQFQGDEMPASILNELKARKKEIISFLKQVHVGDQADAHIPAAPVADDYPLSSAQMRLWVLSQFEAGNIAYNIPGLFVFEGNLNKAALESSLALLIGRYEILRTTFKENEQGEVRQFISPPLQAVFKISFHDLRKVGGEDSVRELIQQEYIQPFDLASGPLMRVNLYQVAENKWIFTYTLHHIISDGWSMHILIKELLLLYNASDNAHANPLPPLRIQYKDYAVWMQQQLETDALAHHKDYWLQQFEGELPVLELPADQPRPALKTFNGKQLSRQLSPQLVNGIKAIGQEQGATLFMNLLALVNTLLHRYTGQEDIIIGSPVAGRDQPDTENQIGLFVNTLALRTKFTGTDNYLQLLDRIKEITLGAYGHQVYPFDDLVNGLNLTRDLSRNPLFDVMLTLQNTNVEGGLQQNLGSTKTGSYDWIQNENSKVDVHFDFVEWGQELRMLVLYNSDIYSSEMMERLADHFGQLMTAVASHPSTPIAELEYLSETEKQQLFSFNDTAASYTRDKTLAQLFEEQVERSPDKIALIFDERAFTYKELNERSNQLAAYLKEQYNILPDEVVGIKLRRSEWLIISILGVLKSGGAYMPVDPDYPQERISYMLEDSNCKVLIDEEQIQGFRNEQARYSGENIPDQNTSTNLVYVIYTSGSTGRPKGCMLEHRGIINRLEWMWQQYNFTASDIILQKTTFTFDVSVWELFLPLCFGARMVLCQKEDIGSPQRILQLIVQHQITCLHFVPSMLNVFTAELFGDDAIADKLESLRMIVTSGEALPLNTTKAWYGRSDVPIHNLYGPTEASVDVTHYSVKKDDARMLIGAPIWNTQMYILGATRQLQPIGILGEICIGGDGLARGYLNKPELTNEKFIANPFKAGERMYRTGDIGRWTPNGKIEYIGRKDNQVKIRGYRVELGEVEAALQSHPAIAACAVVSKEIEGEQELIAYIVSKQELNVMDVRSWLSGKLPGYMVPGRYVELQNLPLTASGKLDRKSLPDAGAGMKTGADYIAPRNETEEQLVIIWQEVLGKDKIGVKDNFFDLGGHSLKATKVLAWVHKEFKMKIGLEEMFNNATIEATSKAIARRNWIAQSNQEDHAELLSTENFIL